MPRNASWDFRDQIAVVTGGTRGIGAAISMSLLRAGAEVIALYRDNTEAADEMREQAGAAAKQLTTVQLDVSDYREVDAFYQRLEGPLHILVNNAAIRRDGLLGMMAVEDWTEVIEVNLNGVFNMCKFAVRRMMSSRDGRIINISSPSGAFGIPGQSNYSATKAGVTGLTRALAREIAGTGITVNSVQPGLIDTDLISDLSAMVIEQMKRDVPMKRLGTAEEVADAVMFLASDQARYITGATLNVAGGI